jgi:hypothetical protein
MIKKLKLLWYILNNYQELEKAIQKAQATAEEAIDTADDVAVQIKDRIDSLSNLISDRTKTHFDLASTQHEPNFVIVIGPYNRQDYIQTYRLPSDADFSYIVDTLKRMNPREIGRIDGPPLFSAVVERYRV